MLSAHVRCAGSAFAAAPTSSSSLGRAAGGPVLPKRDVLAHVSSPTNPAAAATPAFGSEYQGQYSVCYAPQTSLDSPRPSQTSHSRHRVVVAHGRRTPMAFRRHNREDARRRRLLVRIFEDEPPEAKSCKGGMFSPPLRLRHRHPWRRQPVAPLAKNATRPRSVMRWKRW